MSGAVDHDGDSVRTATDFLDPDDGAETAGAWTLPGFRRASYGLLVALGALAALLVTSGLDYGLWRETVPGPGLFPFAIGLLVAILTLIVGVQTVRGTVRPDPETALPDAHGWVRIAAVLGACVVFTVLLEPLGFRVTMVIFVTSLLAYVSRVALWKAALAGVISAVVMHLLFVEALGVPLPDAGWGLLAQMGL